MMRQSVPLMSPQAPIVGTGMEPVVARDSRACLLSDVSGKVTYVDAEKIQVKIKDINPELDLLIKSIWDGSPLTTSLEFSPILVKNILI